MGRRRWKVRVAGVAHRQHDRPAVEAAVVLERPRRDVRQRDPQVPALGQHERLRAVLLLLERRLAADELEALGQLAALAEVGGEPGRHLAPPAKGDAAERFAAALPPRRQLADPRLVRRRRAADRQRRGDLRQRPPERAAGLLVVVVVVVRAEAAAPDPAERRAEPAEAVARARRLLRLLRGAEVVEILLLRLGGGVEGLLLLLLGRWAAAGHRGAFFSRYCFTSRALVGKLGLRRPN